jgi:hypothetical protein
MLATIAACATPPICLEARPSPVVERVVIEQGLVGTVGPIDAPRGRGPPSCALDRA